MLNSINFIDYNKQIPFPHCIQDNILDINFAKELQKEIINISESSWDRYDNPFEQKYTLRDKNKFPKYCSQLFTYLESNEFIEYLSNNIGVKIYKDKHKLYWGIHKFHNGDYLDIHVDAGIHPIENKKKLITLGIYLSKNWKKENGGNIELWTGDNASNNNAKIYKCVKKIEPKFNRLILFTCDDYSWHGASIPVICDKSSERIFLTISYLSDINKKI